MHSIKFKTGVSEVVSIGKDIFEEKSLKKKPYYSENSNGAEVHYAVCPQCDNPVQIIGLYKKLKNTDRPYGKHHPSTVEKLAVYRQEAYNFCPYAKKRKPTKEDRKKELDGIPNEILNLIRTQFDRVVYILSRATNFWFSEKLLRSMLQRYLVTKGYLYTGATLNNLPWIFGYMADSQSLVGEAIRKGSPLQDAILANCPNAVFTDTKSPDFAWLNKKKGAFLNINFSFILHNVTVAEGVLSEQIELVIHQGEHYDNTVEALYQTTLTIDPAYFLRIVSSTSPTTKRNLKHIEIAKELLGS